MVRLRDLQRAAAVLSMQFQNLFLAPTGLGRFRNSCRRAHLVGDTYGRYCLRAYQSASRARARARAALGYCRIECND